MRLLTSMNPAQLSLVPIMCAVLLIVAACQPDKNAGSSSFTLAVIPDTQNYIDFRHQKSEGFEIDSDALFFQQMRYIAEHSVSNGGDISFVAVLGDVWQHQTKTIDDAHLKRGIDIEPDPILGRRSKRTEQVLTFELPTATEGFRIISHAGLPFGVAPGSHDYDATWSVAGFPPNRNKEFSEMSSTVEDLGLLHVGGLDNFRSVFGDKSDFFRDKSWYIASYKGGANSAQKFSAGGYTFLHLALEMHPSDAVITWAGSVLSANPGLPTIFTTHDYLSTSAEKVPNPLVDLARVDPDHNNSPQQMWDKLFSQHDQIFLVLSGHQHGQSFRVDANVNGKPVYQILADYQDRGQAAFDAGRTGRLVGIGDGWLRLMRFDFTSTLATIRVKTYSTYYHKYSSEVEQYARWYKAGEQPDMSEAEFFTSDDFVVSLEDFQQRFAGALSAN